MRRTLAAALAAIAIGGLPAAAQSQGGSAPSAVVAKSCSSGWTHGVIGGVHKCLRRGQFCARSQERAYHRLGFHCHKRDSRGNYHLT
jgi:hypothetical protein